MVESSCQSPPSHQQKAAHLPTTVGRESPILLDRSALEVRKTILADTEKLTEPPAAGSQEFPSSAGRQ